MSIAKNALKASVNSILSPFHMEVRKRSYVYHCSWLWSEDARQAGMEVNDFVEKDHKKPALQELQKTVFPYISSNSIVCEQMRITGPDSWISPTASLTTGLPSCGSAGVTGIPKAT